MKTIVIVGGSKGIGNGVLVQQLENYKVINISRTAPDITHSNLIHFAVDVLRDALPEFESIDALVYCPGSINLKPILGLSLDDFRKDFEINVMGVKFKLLISEDAASMSGQIFAMDYGLVSFKL